MAQTQDTPFQVRYASNLNLGDSVINITNTGLREHRNDGSDVQCLTAAGLTLGMAAWGTTLHANSAVAGGSSVLGAVAQ